MPAFDPSVFFLAIVLVMAFFVIRRGNRQRRELATIQAELGPGAEVMMASGLYATVVALDDEVVTVETAPGQTSRWDRRAVARIVTAAAAGDASAGSESGGEAEHDTVAEQGTQTKDESA